MAGVAHEQHQKIAPFRRQEGRWILDPLHSVPTGAGFTARHADGTVIECVEHRPTTDGY